MTVAEPTNKRLLRLWPGVVIVTVQWLVRFVLPVLVPEAMPIGIIGGLVGGVAILVWWVFFSRAPWSERLGAVVLMIGGLFATSRIVHESIARGAMGMLFPLLAIPILSLTFVAWAVVCQRLSNGPRRAAFVVSILLGCGTLALLRTGGLTANFDNDLHWRWSKTPEEQLLTQAVDEPTLPEPVSTTEKVPEKRNPAKAVEKPVLLPTPEAANGGVDWPGFRGPNRDGIVRGVRIETDWSLSPPVQLWRHPIGPGWSSFAVRGNLVYTQEQRGEDEVVACYNAANGKPVWRHRNAVRFWESNAGAGPRATPQLSNGRVYALGATGILNVLDADGGAVVWTRNVASDTDTKVPMWGFAGSPLVVDDLVVVAASGKLAAYDLATGTPRWQGASRRGSYSSPHRAAIDGVVQILLLSGAGAVSVAPADGKMLWEHPWGEGTTIVQPALTEDGDVLVNAISTAGGLGIRRLAVSHSLAGWTVAERWTSTGLKPYFNDFVLHKDHAFGFDGSILSCISLENGVRKWKGGRYGNGQLVLLADQDLLMVLSEEGELALVKAAPDQFTELAHLPAIEGKTWNHPVIAGSVLLVRNSQEMAAFRLSLADH